MDINRLILELAAKAAMIEQAEQRALKAAAKRVKKNAQDRMGDYQEAEGPFPAWKELKEDTKKGRSKAGFTANDPLVRSGAARDSIESEVDGDGFEVGSNSDILGYQETGTNTIPPRPVIGPAALDEGEEAARMYGEELAATMAPGRIPRRHRR